MLLIYKPLSKLMCNIATVEVGFYELLLFMNPFCIPYVCFFSLHLQSLSRAVANQQNVEFLFRGIGVLSIKNMKVKMKFFKDFLTSMDGSGNLVKVLENVCLFHFILKLPFR